MPTLSIHDLINSTRAIPPGSEPIYKASVYSFFNGLGNVQQRQPRMPEAPVSESFSIYRPVDLNQPPKGGIWFDYYDPHDPRQDTFAATVDPDFYRMSAINGLGDHEKQALQTLPTPLLKIAADELTDPESAVLVKEALRSADPKAAMSILVKNTIQDALYPGGIQVGMGGFKKKLKKLGSKVQNIAKKVGSAVQETAKKVGSQVQAVAKKVGRTVKKGLPFIAIAAMLIPVAGPFIAAAVGLAATAIKIREARKAQLAAKKASKEEYAVAEAEIRGQEQAAIDQMNSVYNQYEEEFTEMGMPRSKWDSMTIDQKSLFFDQVLNEGKKGQAEGIVDPASAPVMTAASSIPVSVSLPAPAPMYTPPGQTPVAPSPAPPPMAQPSTMLMPEPSGAPEGAAEERADVKLPPPELPPEAQAGKQTFGKVLVPLGIAVAAVMALTGGGGH